MIPATDHFRHQVFFFYAIDIVVWYEESRMRKTGHERDEQNKKFKEMIETKHVLMNECNERVSYQKRQRLG